MFHGGTYVPDASTNIESRFALLPPPKRNTQVGFKLFVMVFLTDLGPQEYPALRCSTRFDLLPLQENDSSVSAYVSYVSFGMYLEGSYRLSQPRGRSSTTGRAVSNSGNRRKDIVLQRNKVRETEASDG